MSLRVKRAKITNGVIFKDSPKCKKKRWKTQGKLIIVCQMCPAQYPQFLENFYSSFCLFLKPEPNRYPMRMNIKKSLILVSGENFVLSFVDHKGNMMIWLQMTRCGVQWESKADDPHYSWPSEIRLEVETAIRPLTPSER